MQYRLAPRRYSAPLPENGYLPMRVSEDARSSVVFLGWQQAGPADTAPIDPQGTGFLMAIDPARGRGAVLVTARHVAEGLHPPFVIRMNRKGGGSDLIHIERPEDIRWCFYPDDQSIDLAVAPIAIPGWADVTCYEVRHFLEKDAEKWRHIFVGDDVCVIGLFYPHYGEWRNEPIVHTGHIAMFPSVPIGVNGVPRRGFFAEINAISGCSGSPVFGLRSALITADGVEFIAHDTQVALVGVWSSSWKVKAAEVTAVKTNEDDPSGIAAPLGMGIVTPAGYLATILEGDELKSELQKAEKRRQDALSATHDSLSPTKADNPSHQEDFRTLVSAAAKKRPPSDQT
jgi:hypothetical protein